MSPGYQQRLSLAGMEQCRDWFSMDVQNSMICFTAAFCVLIEIWLYNIRGKGIYIAGERRNGDVKHKITACDSEKFFMFSDYVFDVLLLFCAGDRKSTRLNSSH